MAFSSIHFDYNSVETLHTLSKNKLSVCFWSCTGFFSVLLRQQKCYYVIKVIHTLQCVFSDLSHFNVHSWNIPILILATV